MRSYCLLAFVSLILFGADTRITGIVVDPSGRPVPDAVVECAANKATTAADGHFVVDGPASCDAVIRKTGFDKASVRIEAGRDVRIALSIAPVNEQIVVSATRAPIALEEAGVSATVVTQADFAARQFMQVPDLLREVAGLAVVNTS